MALLLEEALLKTNNYKVKTSASSTRIWKTVAAVLDTAVSPNLVEVYCLPCA